MLLAQLIEHQSVAWDVVVQFLAGPTHKKELRRKVLPLF
jgi:hypothetical protein